MQMGVCVCKYLTTHYPPPPSPLIVTHQNKNSWDPTPQKAIANHHKNLFKNKHWTHTRSRQKMQVQEMGKV
jgi:hypothetical protein